MRCHDGLGPNRLHLLRSLSRSWVGIACFDCWCGFVSHDSYANKLRGYLAGGAKLNKVCKAMGYLLNDFMAFLCVLFLAKIFVRFNGSDSMALPVAVQACSRNICCFVICDARLLLIPLNNNEL